MVIDKVDIASIGLWNGNRNKKWWRNIIITYASHQNPFLTQGIQLLDGRELWLGFREGDERAVYPKIQRT